MGSQDGRTQNPLSFSKVALQPSLGHGVEGTAGGLIHTASGSSEVQEEGLQGMCWDPRMLPGPGKDKGGTTGHREDRPSAPSLPLSTPRGWAFTSTLYFLTPSPGTGTGGVPALQTRTPSCRGTEEFACLIPHQLVNGRASAQTQTRRPKPPVRSQDAADVCLFSSKTPTRQHGVMIKNVDCHSGRTGKFWTWAVMVAQRCEHTPRH